MWTTFRRQIANIQHPHLGRSKTTSVDILNHLGGGVLIDADGSTDVWLVSEASRLSWTLPGVQQAPLELQWRRGGGHGYWDASQ